MRVIARKVLVDFWKQHAETEQPLKAWFDRTQKANWQSSQEVLGAFGTAKVINAERIRFKIHGNDYRLIVAYRFDVQIAWIKFIGTHAEYDRIDAKTVSKF